MDLHTVTALRRPTRAAELAGLLGPGSVPLAGGTWLFSEPQPHVHTLVDLTALGWPAVTVRPTGLEVAATCSLAELARFAAGPAVPAGWSASRLVRPCCEALAGSFKIWSAATVGGNLCLALPAGPMISLAAALDGVALLWPRRPAPAEGTGVGVAPSGAVRRVPVAEFVLGPGRTALDPGEVLRSVWLPASALTARTAFRRAALAPQGRSGSVVIGRLDPGGELVFTVTAAVDRPRRLAFPAPPTAAELAAAVAGIADWFDDPHGAPDWRAAVTAVLAEQIRRELTGTPPGATR